MDPIDDRPEAEVINIVERRRFRGRDLTSGQETCQHPRVLVDEQLAEVECATCGVRLNAAIWMLRQAHEFDRLSRAITTYRHLVWHYEHKRRCVCMHCGRVTDIRHPTTKEIEMEQKARIAEGSVVVVGAPSQGTHPTSNEET